MAIDEGLKVVDPAIGFIKNQQADLADFIFRLTGDLGRSSVMASESCLQLCDDVPSLANFGLLRRLLFKRAYEMNRTTLRPPDRRFLGQYCRRFFEDKDKLARVYRWESILSKLNPQSTWILLLLYRFDFAIEDIAEILSLSLDELCLARSTIEKKLLSYKTTRLEDLKLLPRYSFIVEIAEREMPISVIMRDMKGMQRRVMLRERRGLFLSLFGFVAVVGYWLMQRGKKRKQKPLVRKKVRTRLHP